MRSAALNYHSDVLVDDGSCIVPGCTDHHSPGFNSIATYDSGACPELFWGCTDSASVNFRSLANAEEGSCAYPGCIDPTALNFDATATVPTQCLTRIMGCMDPTAINYYASANVESGVCLHAGCTTVESVNYDSRATTDDGLCLAALRGCMDSSALNYNPAFSVADDSCSFPGCTVTSSLYYSSVATFDDGCSCSLSCQASGRRSLQLDLGGCMDPSSSTYDSSAVVFDVTACRYVIRGCTDASAANFIAAATLDFEPSTCILSVPGCTAANGMLNFDSRATVLEGCSPTRLGCTHSLASNFVADANTDDLSCRYDVYGCTLPNALNFDSTSTVSVGCVFLVPGCLDSNASNFAADANMGFEVYSKLTELPLTFSASVAVILERVTCRFMSRGCRYRLAYNYDSRADIDDGTCLLRGPPSPPLAQSPPPPLPPLDLSSSVGSQINPEVVQAATGTSGGDSLSVAVLLGVSFCGAVLVGCFVLGLRRVQKRWRGWRDFGRAETVGRDAVDNANKQQHEVKPVKGCVYANMADDHPPSPSPQSSITVQLSTHLPACRLATIGAWPASAPTAACVGLASPAALGRARAAKAQATLETTPEADASDPEFAAGGCPGLLPSQSLDPLPSACTGILSSPQVGSATLREPDHGSHPSGPMLRPTYAPRVRPQPNNLDSGCGVRHLEPLAYAPRVRPPPALVRCMEAQSPGVMIRRSDLGSLDSPGWPSLRCRQQPPLDDTPTARIPARPDGGLPVSPFRPLRRMEAQSPGGAGVKIRRSDLGSLGSPMRVPLRRRQPPALDDTPTARIPARPDGGLPISPVLPLRRMKARPPVHMHCSFDDVAELGI